MSATPVRTHVQAHRSAMMLTASLAIDYPSAESAQGLRAAMLVNDDYLAMLDEAVGALEQVVRDLELSDPPGFKADLTLAKAVLAKLKGGAG